MAKELIVLAAQPSKLFPSSLQFPVVTVKAEDSTPIMAQLAEVRQFPTGSTIEVDDNILGRGVKHRAGHHRRQGLKMDPAFLVPASLHQARQTKSVLLNFHRHALTHRQNTRLALPSYPYTGQSTFIIGAGGLETGPA